MEQQLTIVVNLWLESLAGAKWRCQATLTSGGYLTFTMTICYSHDLTSTIQRVVCFTCMKIISVCVFVHVLKPTSYYSYKKKWKWICLLHFPFRSFEWNCNGSFKIFYSVSISNYFVYILMYDHQNKLARAPQSFTSRSWCMPRGLSSPVSGLNPFRPSPQWSTLYIR